MDTDNLIRLTTEGLMLCLTVSLPVIVVAAISGLLVSFVQAVTSLQDQSISHCVKLFATTAAVAVTGAWGAAAILRFANELINVAVPS